MEPPSQGSTDAVGPPPQAGGSRNCVASQLRKTRLCKYSPKGTCKYGSQCTYAHSETELHASPDLSKTRLCKAFQLEGWCNDASCMFAHGEEDLRSTNMFFRKTLCIWNERGPGYCRNGDRCRFAHGREQLHRGPEDRRPKGLRGKPQAAAKAAPQARPEAPAPARRSPEACPLGAPEARPQARGAAAGPPPLRAGPFAGRPGTGGLPYDSPMKVYPVSPSGDEHPGLMTAAYAMAASRPTQAEGLARQLESLCHQLSALTVQMSAAGSAAPDPRCFGLQGGDSRPLFPVHYDSRGALGGGSAARKPCG